MITNKSHTHTFWICDSFVTDSGTCLVVVYILGDLVLRPNAHASAFSILSVILRYSRSPSTDGVSSD